MNRRIGHGYGAVPLQPFSRARASSFWPTSTSSRASWSVTEPGSVSLCSFRSV